ncbi:FHA domain-containing protein [Nocardia sp. 2]|uniref:FHA domain-containing protein n=1 Tax=Nocardia acididurans TaxID=2802282 RepID=A0ABS1M8S0_9NOCA|nr:FHA domain-containing protein [Nocardia acididurans]MBL1076996.1 FHA domain-containing protein [Nocardia acididurans]
MRGRVEVVPGTHLVARIDGVVVVVAHRTPAPVTPRSESVATLDTLEKLVRESSSRETRRTGRTFARLATTWLMSRDDEESVEFGVLTPGTRGMAVFLHGGVTALLHGDDHHEILHGRDAGFSVDRVVFPAPEHAAGIFVDTETPWELPEPGVWSLVAGRMPGAGAVLWLREPPHDLAAPSATPAGSPWEPADSRTPRTVAPAAVPTPADPASSTPAHGDAPVATVMVRGFLCARGHLNDPRLPFCTVCGVRMDQGDCVPTEGPRPPLGALLLDDGTAYPLATDLVIGREPERSERIRHGAQPVRIPDASGGMSRVHAEIRLLDWDVTVVDRGSANGTHLRPPGRADWTRTVPGHPTVLEPGTQILLGGRVFTYDPHT